MSTQGPVPAAPTLPQAVGGKIELAILQHEGVKIRVPVYDGMKVGDRVTPFYHPYPMIPPVGLQPAKTVEAIGPIDFVIDKSSVGQWKTLEVGYMANFVESGKMRVDVKW